MKETFILLTLCTLYFNGLAQESLYFGGGFPFIKTEITNLRSADIPDNKRNAPLRWELLYTSPLGEKGFQLEIGVSYLETVYDEFVSYDPQSGSFGVLSTDFYENQITHWQIPIRIQKSFWNKNSITLSGLAGMTGSFNDFERTQNFEASRNISDGDVSITQFRSFEEINQSSFSVLADFGLRSSFKVFHNLCIEFTVLQQLALSEIHHAEYQYKVQESSMPNVAVERTGSIRSNATNLSLNFGLRYMLGKKQTQQVKRLEE